MSGDGHAEQDQDRICRILDQHLASVQSPEIAHITLEKILERADGSESDRSDRLTGDRAALVQRIERAAGTAPGPETLAEILTQLTAYALSRTEAASIATSSAYAVFGAGPPSLTDPASRGRDLLRSAVLDNMHQFERAEAEVFIGVNGLPQPAWMRKGGQALEFLATGGRMWIIAALIGAVLRAPNSRGAILVACPTASLIAAVVEWLIKPLLVRWRSFRHAVSMMVLGVRPRRHSFPSGHAAASWAGALLFSRLWPGGRAVFVAVAALVSVSRVYLGAHGPGDVLVGSLVGLVLAELVRRPFERIAHLFR